MEILNQIKKKCNVLINVQFCFVLIDFIYLDKVISLVNQSIKSNAL